MNKSANELIIPQSNDKRIFFGEVDVDVEEEEEETDSVPNRNYFTDCVVC